jgi:hypothetical protein
MGGSQLSLVLQRVAQQGVGAGQTQLAADIGSVILDRSEMNGELFGNFFTGLVLRNSPEYAQLHLSKFLTPSLGRINPG